MDEYRNMLDGLQWDFGNDREALRNSDENSEFNSRWRMVFTTERRNWPSWGQKFYDKYKWTLDDSHWNPYAKGGIWEDEEDPYTVDAESFEAEKIRMPKLVGWEESKEECGGYGCFGSPYITVQHTIIGPRGGKTVEEVTYEAIAKYSKIIRKRAESFGAEKKNCGCGQDPCVTYGAEPCESESFEADNTKFELLGSKYIEGVGIVTEGSPYLKNYYGEMDEYNIYDDDAAEIIMSIPINDSRLPLKDGEIELIKAMVYGYEHPRINDSWGELNEDGMFWTTKVMETLANYEPSEAESSQ